LDILAGFFADRNWTADDPAGLEDFPVGSTKFPCLRNFNSLIPHSKRAR
jgi:hypothetical protein